MPLFEVVWPKGIGYRSAPELSAKAEDRRPAKRGDVVGSSVAPVTCAGPAGAPKNHSMMPQLHSSDKWQQKATLLCIVVMSQEYGSWVFGFGAVLVKAGSNRPPCCQGRG